MSVESTVDTGAVEASPAHARRESVETVDCSFCGSPDYSRYDSVDDWLIVKCNRCGFCFTNPRPTLESLPSYYDLSYFRDGDVKRFGFFNQYAPGNPGADLDYHQRIADIESCVDKRGRLLELGAAAGGFLNVMRARGWKVDGVEVSRDAVELAKKENGVDIFCGTLAEFESDETYEVVCMYHSLEHTPNPAYVIDRSYELLKPRGIIVIEVPNLAGFDARFNRERKLLSYDLPRHLNHFTPAIITKTLEKKGFEILDIDLYYPDFILRLAEARTARLPKRDVDNAGHDSGDGSGSQTNIDLPLARKNTNWKTRLLKYGSQLFPGWRFTIVARK